jgi:protein-S-isoprenylcysteine O-methyltransferase Ste14
MKEENKIQKKIIHIILIHGYLVFFIFVILGFILNLFFNIKILESSFSQTLGILGIIGIIFGTILIYWAQKSSSLAGKIKKEESSTEGFKYGPYKYFKDPSYLGVFIMTLGLSFILNSLPSLILVFIAYIIIKFVFVKKEDKLLEDKYGKIFLDYKNKIKK